MREVRKGYFLIYSFCWIGKHFQAFLLPLWQVLVLMSPQPSFSVSFMASFIAGGKNINEGYGTGSNNLKKKLHNKGKKHEVETHCTKVVP